MCFYVDVPWSFLKNPAWKIQWYNQSIMVGLATEFSQSITQK